VSEQDRVARFECLHTATYQAVVAYAVRRCDDRADAADAIAETYLVLWRRLDEAPSVELLLPWLYGVARKVIANQRRGQQRQSALAARLALELAELPVVQGPESQQRAELQRAFAALRESDRELLRLIAWEQLDRDQIALTLGVSRATARVRIHRARQRFTEAFHREDVDAPGSADTPAPPLARPRAQEAHS
jgi:RNA polymerase sigma factor (sigma-70 family)